MPCASAAGCSTAPASPSSTRWSRSGGPTRTAGIATASAGRSGTDADGRYGFVTVKPGGDGAPFLTVLIFARGLLKPLMTRIYFPGEPAANAADPLLAALTDAERDGLTASTVDGELRFDIHLQGERQTTFLAL